MGATPPTVVTVTHVSVTISGPQIPTVDPNAMQNLLFTSCKPPDWSIEAPPFVYHGSKGAPETIIPAVMQPKYGTMTLSQGWDPDHVLASWMNLISDATKAISDKKAQVTVVFNDSTNQPLFQWVGDGALLTSFSHSASDANSNAVLMVNATISADTWHLTDSSSNPL